MQPVLKMTFNYFYTQCNKNYVVVRSEYISASTMKLLLEKLSCLFFTNRREFFCEINLFLYVSMHGGR